MKNVISILILFSVSFWINTETGYSKNNPNEKPLKSQTIVTAETCSPSTAKLDLEINNVRARIMTGGDMWWDLQGNAQYIIPNSDLNQTSMFSAALWIGGIDVNNQLKCAAQRYRSGGGSVDYYTGPVSTVDASVTGEVCEQYDKFFVITRSEVQAHVAWFKSPSEYPDYAIPKSISEWPAHGDVTKGQSYYLAPFFDYDGNGTYDPNAGDYPYYDFENDLCQTNPENKSKPLDPTMETEAGIVKGGILVDQILKGDETFWWVFNDKGNIHGESNGTPIGLEIRAQAFAFATNDEINNMTFYSYEIINRSTYKLNKTYFSQWVDTDLGDAWDDYVGCDVNRGLGYCYNGKDVDGTGLPDHYGDQPPAIGVDFFQGPYIDPDGVDNPEFTGDCSILNSSNETDQFAINGVNFGDSIVDNERFGMRRFVYHNNSSGVQGDPTSAIEYYNYLKGIWRDGTEMHTGGNAHQNDPEASGPVCDFMFPGNSDPCNWGTDGVPTQFPINGQYWTEKQAKNAPGDRRFMESAGPFTLQPGAVNYITVGIPWARASSGGPMASVELLRVVDDKCQMLFDNCFKILDGPDAPDLIIQELDKELILYLSNRKSSNNYNEEYTEYDPRIQCPDTVTPRWDSLYRFEGYQVFQLKDATANIADIDDPDKVRLVAQCDLKNGVGQLVNYYYSEKLGGSEPEEEVSGEDKGIKHTFKITDDAFATGDRTLVNHKQYYFMAIAYGYNNYMEYSQDPGVVNGLYGQKEPYIAGRKDAMSRSISYVIGIPHKTQPEDNGKTLNSSYGDGPQITRLEGCGNGGNILDLTEQSINDILNSATGSVEQVTYQGGKGPINVKVVDPLNVVNANFTLKFDLPADNDIDSSNWTLTNTDNGLTYSSEKCIRITNEQLLLDLGISVTIEQCYNPGSDDADKNGFIESTIEYADSSKKWFSGVADVDGGGNYNWIRSGMVEDDNDDDNNDYIPGSWYDPEEYYEKVLNGTWAPYKLCSHSTSGNGPSLYDASYMVNNITNSFSVDIVLTPDKTKWSRSCVIEMSASTALAEGGKAKFGLRAGQSVGQDGNSDGTGTGMGWFPGYAINVETGERLNIMFGEDSWLVAENGRDMKFNPTSNKINPVHGDYPSDGDFLFGGKHYIYIIAHNSNSRCPAYDGCSWVYSKLTTGGTSDKQDVYKDIMWVGIPLAVSGKEDLWLSNEAKIRIRVTKPYKRYLDNASDAATSAQNNNYPMYSFSTSGLQPVDNDNTTAKDALSLINIIPNPYYAYDSYETNQLDNRVRIANIPEKCTISIYTINGIMIRQFNVDLSGVDERKERKDAGDEESEAKTSIDWDLKNYAGIPISSGIYLIHIKADGVGERVVKWFGAMRPTDLNAF